MFIGRNALNIGLQNILNIKGGNIKNFEITSGTITSGNTTGTVTLSNAVNEDNTLILGFHNLFKASSSYQYNATKWELTSTTEITLTRDTASATPPYDTIGNVDFFVIEFEDNIILSQQIATFTVPLGGTADSITDTISSVDTNYSFPISYGRMSTAAQSNGSSTAMPTGFNFSFNSSTEAQIDTRIDGSANTHGRTEYVNIVEFVSV